MAVNPNQLSTASASNNAVSSKENSNTNVILGPYGGTFLDSIEQEEVFDLEDLKTELKNLEHQLFENNGIAPLVKIIVEYAGRWLELPMDPVPFTTLLAAKSEDASPTAFLGRWQDLEAIFHYSGAYNHYNLASFKREMRIVANTYFEQIRRPRIISIDLKQAASSVTTQVASTSSNAAIVDNPTSHIAVVYNTVQGQSLKNVISPHRGKWTHDRILNALSQLANALTELHSFGLIYSDLCPENILISPIGDLTIASFHDLNRYLQTPKPSPNAMQYRAPEFLDAASASKGSVAGDVFAFGSIAFAVAAGQEINAATSDAALLTEKVERVDNMKLREIILRCWNKKPELRPTMMELAREFVMMKAEAAREVPHNLTRRVDSMGWGGGSMGPLQISTAPQRSNYENPTDYATTPATDHSYKSCLKRMGRLDEKYIKTKDDYDIFIVHRPNGNVVLVTSGLANFNGNPKKTRDVFPGLEIAIEIDKDEFPNKSKMGADFYTKLYEHPLYNIVLSNVVRTAKASADLVRNGLRQCRHITMRFKNEKIPKSFLDSDGFARIFLGIDAESVPKYYINKRGTQYPFILASLLTAKEWLLVQEWELGKRTIAARFSQGARHVTRLLSLKENTATDKKILDELAKAGNSILLQKLSPQALTIAIENYNNPIPAGILVQKFYPHPVSTLLFRISKFACQISFDETFPQTNLTDNSQYQTDLQLKNFAKAFINLFRVHNFLLVLEEFSDYIDNPELYNEYRNAKTKKNPKAVPIVPPTPTQSPFAKMICTSNERAYLLTKILMWIIEKTHEIASRDIPHYNPKTYDSKKMLAMVAVHTHSAEWKKEAENFLADIDRERKRHILEHPPTLDAFNTFRDLPTENMIWPHSDEVLKIIREADFEFKPSRLKPDNCVCQPKGNEPSCDAEFCIIRSWDSSEDIVALHNFSKHTDKFKRAHGYREAVPSNQHSASTATATATAAVPSTAAATTAPAAVATTNEVAMILSARGSAAASARMGTAVASTADNKKESCVLH